MNESEKYEKSLLEAVNTQFCSFINSIGWTKEALNGDLDDKISTIQSIVEYVNDIIIILRKDNREDLISDLLKYTYEWWLAYDVYIDLLNNHKDDTSSLFMWSYWYPIGNFNLQGLIHIYVNIYWYFYWIQEKMWILGGYGDWRRDFYISDKELLNSAYINTELKEYLKNDLMKNVRNIRNKYWVWKDWKAELYLMLSKN